MRLILIYTQIIKRQLLTIALILLFSNTFGQDGWDLQDYYEYANEFYFKGSYELAIENYSKVVELDSTHAQAFFQRGSCKLKTNEYDEAISDYTIAGNLNKAATREGVTDFDRYSPRGEMNSYFAIGNVWLAKGDYKKYYKFFSIGLELGDNEEHRLMERGKVMIRIGETARACQDSKKARLKGGGYYRGYNCEKYEIEEKN